MRDVWNDRELQHLGSNERDSMVLRLDRRAPRAEIPLLSHDLLKPSPALGQPAQDMLLRSLDPTLDELKSYAADRLRALEADANALVFGVRGAPAVPALCG